MILTSPPPNDQPNNLIKSHQKIGNSLAKRNQSKAANSNDKIVNLNPHQADEADLITAISPINSADQFEMSSSCGWHRSLFNSSYKSSLLKATAFTSKSSRHKHGRSQNSLSLNLQSQLLKWRFISKLFAMFGCSVSLLVLLSLVTTVPANALDLDLGNLTQYETNVSFISLEFSNSSNTDLKRVIFDTNLSALFVGAVNQIYKIYLNNIAGGQKSNGQNEYLFIHQRVTFGNASLECLASQSNPQKCGFDNQIRTLVIFRNTLFACGTAQYGLCEAFKCSDIVKHKQFGSPNNPKDMIASRTSVVAFLSTNPKPESGFTSFYVGTEYDDRPLNMTPPFVSSRIFTTTEFSYSASTSAAKSYLQISPVYRGKYHVKFIYGFYHNGFAYFVTIQPSRPNSVDYETKLARVCENDPRFFSYTEIPLICYHDSTLYTIASAATLAVSVMKKNHEYNVTSSSDSKTTSLFVAFDPYQPSASDGSALCSFDMDSIERHFVEMSIDCSKTHSKTELLQTIYGEPTSCTLFEDSINENDIICGSNPINRYINGKAPLSVNASINIRNDRISSLGVVSFHRNSDSPNIGLPMKPFKILQMFAFIGTEKSNILKIAMQEDLDGDTKMKTIFVSHLNSGPILPDPALDLYTMTYYALTNRTLFRVPMDSCTVYSSCASCLKPGGCGWMDGQCYKVDSKNKRINPTSCAPEVFSFSPKVGPLEGGTVITFKGTNFGSGTKFIPNTNMKINVGGFKCDVIERRFDFVQCQLVDIIANPLTKGEITFEAYEFDNSFSEGLYKIEGKIILEEKFLFKSATIKGIHPPYGPFSGGTNVMIFGDNLSIGSKHEVLLGDSPCNLLNKTDNYIFCKSGHFKPTSVSKNQSNFPQQVTLKIDSCSLIMNNENRFFLDTSRAIGIYDNRRRRSRNQIRREAISPTAAKLYFDLKNSSLEFNENFQYRPDPLVNNVKNLVSIYSGRTEVYFFGKHFDSIYYPKLEIIFEQKSNKANPRIVLQSACYLKIPNNGTLLACKIPSLIDNQSIHHKSKHKADLLLRLDGLSYPPLTMSDPLEMVYYHDPKFNLIKKNIQISSKDRTIVLSGNFLDINIPFNITLDKTYPCIYQTGVPDHTKIKCSFEVNDTQLAKLYRKNMSLTVELGDNNYIIGYASFINEAGLSSFQFGIIGIVLALLAFVILFMCYFYLHQKDKCEYTSVANANAPKLQLMPTRTLEWFFDQAFDNDDTLYKALLDRNLIIPSEKVDKEDKRIGNGQFGVVYLGSYDEQRVAIKQLITKTEGQYDESAQIQEVQQTQFFLKEADTMKDFKHRNVMSILGITLLDNKPSIIMPFMMHGDLRRFLMSSHNQTLGDIIKYAIQIASGMNYLANRKFVHRDLAARNCMIDSTYTVKVADFGLSREFQGKDYYKSENNMEMPFRWMAIESLINFHFTTESDVWAYGVLFWELTTRGEMPYEPDINFNYLIDFLKRGNRLLKPNYVPEGIFLIAQSCWYENPKERPTFAELEQRFRDNYNLLLGDTDYQVEKTDDIEYELCPFNYNSSNIKKQIEQQYLSSVQMRQQNCAHLNGNVVRSIDSVVDGYINGGVNSNAVGVNHLKEMNFSNGNCDDLNTMETTFNEFPPPYSSGYSSDFYNSPANVPSASHQNVNNAYLQPNNISRT